MINRDKIINEYLKGKALRNLKALGIERTLETIERLRNPIYRAKMRQLHLNVLKQNQGGQK